MVALFRRRSVRTLALVLLVLLVGLNLLAYRHARAMTHFAADGTWRGRPPMLSAGTKARLLFGGLSLPRPNSDAKPLHLGLACEVHHLDGEAGRLEGWYIPHDQSRGLVLLFHGYKSCKGVLLGEARAFHDLGFSCFLLDFRGSGGSDGNVTTIGYHEAGDVAAAAEYAARRWPGQPLILFGQSMGAAAVLRALGVLGVAADAAILECPFDRLRTAVRMRFAGLGVPSFPCAELLVFWGGAQHGFNGFRHNPIHYARGVTCPVLLLHGADDPQVRPEHVEEIAANLAGPAEVVPFEGLGHEQYVPRQVVKWKREVSAFLRGQGVVK
jgi:alpha-beta hydrolase superfamily lysophospholipase